VTKEVVIDVGVNVVGRYDGDDVGFDVTGLDVGVELCLGELLGLFVSITMGPFEIVGPTLGIPKGWWLILGLNVGVTGGFVVVGIKLGVVVGAEEGSDDGLVVALL